MRRVSSVMPFVVLISACAFQEERTPLVRAREPVTMLSGSGKIGHTSFAFTITAADVAKAPGWSPEAGQPPLSRRQAKDIARRQLRKYAKNLSEWHLREAKLLEMSQRHWIYFVGFDRTYPNKESGIVPDSFNVPVLMDGTVIAPKIFRID